MKNKRYYFSYQRKLTVIFAVMTISVIIAFAAVMFQRQQENLAQTLYRTVQIENQKNAAALGNVFESIRDLAAALALNESLYESIEELPDIAGKTDFNSLDTQQDLFKTMLISKLATMPRMRDMRLYSSNGMCVSVTKQRSSIEGWNYWDQDWFEPFVVNNRDWMIYFSQEEGKPVLTICRTVRKVRTGILVGYLVVNFDFQKDVEEILEATSLEDGYRYYLLQGGSLAVTNDGESRDPEEQDVLAGQLAGLKELPSGTVTKLSLDGEDYLMAFSGIDDTDFTLVSGVDSGVLKEQTGREIQLLVLVLILGPAAAVGISCYAAKGLARNIHKLNSAMQEAENNPKIQVEIRSHDEISMLGESFNRMIVRLRKNYKDLYQAELELKEAQNLALQAQINPHFLYNTLETIDALSVCERTEDIGRIVQSLSKVFRYAMEEKKCVPLREELGHVSEYLEILGIRYENRFVWELDAEENLLDIEMPKIILQPLAENSIIHSILKLERPGRIVVRARRKEGWILLEVLDDGAGMTEESLAALKARLASGAEEERSRKHIGVQNVDRRLKYFFGERYHMEIESILRKETRVAICIRDEDGWIGQ